MYDGDTLTLNNAPDQVIRGASDLEPGTDIEILLDSETASDPFVKRPEATVQSDATFSTTADLSNNDEGAEFTVEATNDGETLATAEGRIVWFSKPARAPPFSRLSGKCPLVCSTVCVLQQGLSTGRYDWV